MHTSNSYTAVHISWIFIGILTSILVSDLCAIAPAQAQSQATGTVTFELEKKFSGPYPTGYAADQFTFSVSGYVTPVPLTTFTTDSALGTIALPVGTYQLTETGPIDFIPGEWTVQWSGAGCTNQTANSTTITVNERDIGSTNFGCRADNQWRHGNLLVTKEVVGTSTPPENFNFRVVQGDRERFSGAFEPDGQTEVLVAAGSYTVFENVHPNFTTAYSADCAGTMIQGGSKSCTITNTYTDGGNGTTSTGRIVIQKQAVPLSTSSNFTFDPSWSEADIVLTAGAQSTSSELMPGVYSFNELAQAGWIHTSTICSDGSASTAIMLDAGEIVTCVVTNTQTGGSNEERYKVFGYVWHDRNENTVWEVVQPNPADDESDLDGWEVRISDGSTTLATTTDALGYYYFEVPVGTWKITEVVQSLWKVTFPVTNEHTVRIITDVASNNRKADTVWEKIINYVLPSVYAQSDRIYGPFNFGNVQSDSDDDGRSGGRGGGHSSRSSTVSAEPRGLILGATTSTLPVGAPNTGAGGTSLPTYSGRVLPFMAIPERRCQQIVLYGTDKG